MARRKLPVYSSPQNYAQIRDMLVRRDGMVCGICKKPISDRFRDVNFDHIIPRSKGGSNHLDNLQLTHITCNLAKGSG